MALWFDTDLGQSPTGRQRLRAPFHFQSMTGKFPKYWQTRLPNNSSPVNFQRGGVGQANRRRESCLRLGRTTAGFGGVTRSFPQGVPQNSRKRTWGPPAQQDASEPTAGQNLGGKGVEAFFAGRSLAQDQGRWIRQNADRCNLRAGGDLTTTHGATGALPKPVYSAFATCVYKNGLSVMRA